MDGVSLLQFSACIWVAYQVKVGRIYEPSAAKNRVMAIKCFFSEFAKNDWN